MLEEVDNVTFVRPPRFGKSLFASMLASYADIATTDEQYDRWFAGTEIYEVNVVIEFCQFKFNSYFRKRYLKIILHVAWQTKHVCSQVPCFVARLFN